MVYGAPGHHPAGGHPSLREHLHRDVLHLYFILGIQDLLRLRVHAARLVNKIGHFSENKITDYTFEKLG